MRIALREDDDFPGCDPDRLSANETGEAMTFGNHMIGDQMFGARQDLRQDHLPRRLLGNPGRSGHDIKECRASQPHCSQ